MASNDGNDQGWHRPAQWGDLGGDRPPQPDATSPEVAPRSPEPVESVPDMKGGQAIIGSVAQPPTGGYPDEWNNPPRKTGVARRLIIAAVIGVLVVCVAFWWMSPRLGSRVGASVEPLTGERGAWLNDAYARGLSDPLDKRILRAFPNGTFAVEDHGGVAGYDPVTGDLTWSANVTCASASLPSTPETHLYCQRAGSRNQLVTVDEHGAIEPFMRLPVGDVMIYDAMEIAANDVVLLANEDQVRHMMRVRDRGIIWEREIGIDQFDRCGVRGETIACIGYADAMSISLADGSWVLPPKTLGARGHVIALADGWISYDLSISTPFGIVYDSAGEEVGSGMVPVAPILPGRSRGDVTELEGATLAEDAEGDPVVTFSDGQVTFPGGAPKGCTMPVAVSADGRVAIVDSDAKLALVDDQGKQIDEVSSVLMTVLNGYLIVRGELVLPKR